MADKIKLVICGSGGHARSVLDIAMQNGIFDIVGCLDPAYPEIVKIPSMEEIPIIGTDNDLPSIFNQGIRHIFIAIGSNRLREKLYNYASDIGFEAVNIISKHAIISPKARLGKGICAMAGAIVNACTQIGNGSILNTNCSIDHDDNIGAFCHIAPGSTVCGYVTIGMQCFVGAGARIIDSIAIGNDVIIGAGAAVIRDIPGGHTAVGVPAKIIK